MLLIVLLTLLVAAIQAQSSYSGDYGEARGEPFSQSDNQLEGPITAIRIRGSQQQCIKGLQVRYGRAWSDHVGGTRGDVVDTYLLPDESVTYVSGKYKDCLKEMTFLTNYNRTLHFGKDTGLGAGSGTHFSAAPLYPHSVLRFISGRADRVIRSIGLHWDQPQSLQPLPTPQLLQERANATV